tara:strand:- start:39349 stop:39915 length:567 start_codon:yes stop_codon:yes gene_type:complete
MPANINTFFNIASQKQFSRDFFFRVKQIVVPGMSLDGETDLVFARTANLPGRDIENKVVNYSGQAFNLNGKSSYPGSEAYSLEFYMDQGLDLRTKFEKASRLSFDNETTTGQMCMPGPESYIILDVLGVPCGQGNEGGQGMETIETIKLVGVGIRNIGEVGYEIADGSGEIKTITCSFSYHWYENFAK